MFNLSTTTTNYSNQVVELYRPNIIQFESLDILYKKFIEFITDKTLEISGEYGTTRLALSSATTLNEIYKLIGKSYTFPYEEVELFQTEENHSNNSSQLTIARNLTKPFLDLSKYINFVKSDSNVLTDVQNYSDVLDQFDEEEGFDICVLEINKNGEIAGLIANGNGLDGESDMVVSNKDIISASIPMILRSREIICVLNDDNDVLEEIMEGQRQATDFPAKMLLVHPNVTIFYYLDI
jgi:6-phosphogluconolactonase/glucosamine-6-phosphate isomerase/deaminase